MRIDGILVENFTTKNWLHITCVAYGNVLNCIIFDENDDTLTKLINKFARTYR